MFWRSFPKHKPKEDGWYLCSITFGDRKHKQSYVMNLYWYSNTQQFIDNIRQSVFDVYDVRSITGKKLYTDDRLVNRTGEVTGWRKVPKYYVTGAKRAINQF